MTQAQLPTIEYSDFEKVDIRAGRIVSAESVPRSELLKMQVDFGSLGMRQVLARIGKDYTPEWVTGVVAAFVVNLAPRTMKGLESQAMVLAAPNPTGEARLVIVADAAPGSQVG